MAAAAPAVGVGRPEARHDRRRRRSGMTGVGLERTTLLVLVAVGVLGRPVAAAAAAEALEGQQGAFGAASGVRFGMSDWCEGLNRSDPRGE